MRASFTECSYQMPAFKRTIKRGTPDSLLWQFIWSKLCIWMSVWICQ